MMWNEFKVWLLVTLHPKYWLQNNAIDHEWDKAVREMIRLGVPVKANGEHTVMMGGTKVWTANYPYAYGHVWGRNDGLPTRRTRVYLKRYVGRELSRQRLDKAKAEAFGAQTQ